MKQECANYLITEAFAELEGDPDWYMLDSSRHFRFMEFWQQFDAEQRTELRNAATHVAHEIRHGAHAEKANPYDIINNNGPYPVDISCLMDPKIPADSMRSMWDSMIHKMSIIPEVSRRT